MENDIRWIQRFENFKTAFAALTEAVELSNARELSKLEKQGLIQSFEFTHEIAWNVLKDYLQWKGIFGIVGSKDSTREAFKNELISAGDVWMEMITARNLTSHTYNQSIAEAVYASITQSFFPAFFEFSQRFQAIAEQSSDE